MDQQKPHLFCDHLAEVLCPRYLMDGFEIAVDLIDDAAAELNFQHKPLEIFIAAIVPLGCARRGAFQLSCYSVRILATPLIDA